LPRLASIRRIFRRFPANEEGTGGGRGAILSRLALALAIAALAARGAAAGPLSGDSDGRLEWDGRERSFLLHVPAKTEGAMPVVIVLHGANGNAAAFAEETRFAGEAERRHMLTVFPDGTETEPGKRSWNAHFCCGVAAKEKIDDTGFIAALIDHLAERMPLDRKRVYLTGMSNGAMLAYQFAAARPDLVAAIAPVSGTIGGTSRDGERFVIATPDRPVPVLIIHGRQDPFVLFNGGTSALLNYPKRSNMAVGEALSFWSTVDGCAPLPERSEPVPGTLLRVAYPECRDGSEVVLLEIETGDHSWPVDPIFPATDGVMRSASAEILSFFAAHHRD
jgi:polyhydroxybutyrate depolymerase